MACVTCQIFGPMALYEPEFDEARVYDLVRRAVESRSWLIFFTHDVSESPSDYGLTPENLRQVIEWCIDEGCQVLPVREAAPLAFGGAD